MDEAEKIRFKKHMDDYFRDTPLDQIRADVEAARPKEVPSMHPHEGFVHTCEYRTPKGDEWYQSAGPKKPKQIMEGQESSYGPNQKRWILKRLED